MKEKLLIMKMNHTEIAVMIETFKLEEKRVGIVGKDEDTDLIGRIRDEFEDRQDEVIQENYFCDHNLFIMAFEDDETIPPLDIFIEQTAPLELDVLIFINPPKYMSREDYITYRDSNWKRVITIFTPHQCETEEIQA